MSVTSPCTSCAKFFGNRCDGQLDEALRCEKHSHVMEPSPMPKPKDHDGKADKGKPDLNLVDRYFPNALDGVARVADFGLKKYGIDTWKDVPDALRRYKSAMRRHQTEIEKGHTHDPESGELHVDHVAWNSMAVSELTKLASDK